MTCAYDELCGLAAAGQLSAVEIDALSKHMTGCRACRERFAEMEAASRLLYLFHASRAEGVAVPAGMQQRFEAQAARHGMRVRRTQSRPGAARLTAVAACVAVVALAGMFWRGAGPALPLRPVTETSGRQASRAAASGPGVRGGPFVAARAEHGTVLTRRSDGRSEGRRRGGAGRMPRSLPAVAAAREQRDVSARGGFHADAALLGSPAGGRRFTPTFRLVPDGRFGASISSRLPLEGPGFLLRGKVARYPTVTSVSLLEPPARARVFRVPLMNEPASLFAMTSARRP